MLHCSSMIAVRSVVSDSAICCSDSGSVHTAATVSLRSTPVTMSTCARTNSIRSALNSPASIDATSFAYARFLFGDEFVRMVDTRSRCPSCESSSSSSRASMAAAATAGVGAGVGPRCAFGWEVPGRVGSGSTAFCCFRSWWSRTAPSSWKPRAFFFFRLRLDPAPTSVSSSDSDSSAGGSPQMTHTSSPSVWWEWRHPQRSRSSVSAELDIVVWHWCGCPDSVTVNTRAICHQTQIGRVW
jgi:hypothetical protein